MTVRLTFSCTKTFLSENNIKLSDKFWRSITRRIKGSRARTQDLVSTNKEPKQLMMHLHIQGRSLFLTLVSSSIRISEALKLELDGIFLDETPARVNILLRAHPKQTDKSNLFYAKSV